ncbi:MAG TPA: hypothetical protein VFS99_08750 [Xanthomonadaceae bacterium]|nr:hypothetical protein [Xanthomonadaceae bacterium]
MIRPLALACLFSLAATPVLAQAANDKPQFEAADLEVMGTAGFLSAHPDLRWRTEALAALEDHRAGEAFDYFMRAARYADKPSQAMVAEMLWTGTGVPVDRPRAYAWMDVAAERAYVPFLAKREQYWNTLSETERAQALEVGAAIYDEYNDSVAKERLERLLRRAQRNVTGSRTGFVGNLQVMVPGPGGVMLTIDGSRYYDEQYWEPEHYWAWQDSIWKDPPKGTVSVRPLEVVTGDEPSTADDGDGSD